jgi:hypothetical protein
LTEAGPIWAQPVNFAECCIIVSCPEQFGSSWRRDIGPNNIFAKFKGPPGFETIMATT